MSHRNTVWDADVLCLPDCRFLDKDKMDEVWMTGPEKPSYSQCPAGLGLLSSDDLDPCLFRRNTL